MKFICRVAILGVGPLLLALAFSLLPQPLAVQAVELPLRPKAEIQSRTAVTIYLPIVNRISSPEQQLVDLINSERQRQGLTALTSNPILMQVAKAHSQDMVDRNFLGHTNPDGLGPGDRLSNAGYKWQACGETLGGGYATPQAMFIGWMNSSGHRAILLSASYTEIGIGYANGGDFGHYWTADFARPWP